MNKHEGLLTGGGRGVRDGKAEGLSVTGNGRQAAISLTPDVDGMRILIFESSQPEGSCVGELLY